MSKIPSPQDVAEGRLPSVEEKRVFAEEVIARFSTEDVKLVLYGSIARGDATLRSDIDLCATPPDKKYVSLDHFEIESWAKQEIARHGWETSLTVLNCASKRGDADHNRVRFDNPSDVREARFSITTFDHFGFLSCDSRFSSETRRLYAMIQKDIRKYTGTNKEARFRDLVHYVERSLQFPGKYLLPVNWRERSSELGHLGWAENVAYHVLRKLGGVTKTLKNTDTKTSLAGCFNPSVPFFAELLSNFGVIRQFGQDIEEALSFYLGRPEQIGEYEKFLDGHLKVMAQAAITILELVQKELEGRTLLETVAVYDRDAPKTVVLSDRFEDWLDEWRRDNICIAVHWWCMGDKVYVDRPIRAYVDYKGETLPMVSNYFGGKKLNRLYVTAEGRVEINFGPSPSPKRPYIYARPTKLDRPDYKRAAELSHEAVIARLREILPADINMTAPSP